MTDAEKIAELQRRLAHSLHALFESGDRLTFSEQTYAMIASQLQRELRAFERKHGPFPINTGITAAEARSWGDDLRGVIFRSLEDVPDEWELWCDGFEFKLVAPERDQIQLGDRTLHFHSIPKNPRFLAPR